MIRLAWWEHSELLEHLASRTDIWSRSAENPGLWLRTYVTWASDDSTQEEPALGLLFEREPTGTFLVKPVPLSWTPEGCETYVQRLLSHWTSYGHRLRVISFFVGQLGLDVATAELLSIALEGIDEDVNAPLLKVEDPEDVPAQGTLYPDSLPPIFPAPKDPSDLGTWLLGGGSGWVKLKLLGGMLRVQISMRHRLSGGFGPLLEGHVRPTDGRVRDYAASLVGWPEAEVRHDVSVQAKLESSIIDNAPEDTSLDDQIAMLEARLKEMESPNA